MDSSASYGYDGKVNPPSLKGQQTGHTLSPFLSRHLSSYPYSLDNWAFAMSTPISPALARNPLHSLSLKGREFQTETKHLFHQHSIYPEMSGIGCRLDSCWVHEYQSICQPDPYQNLGSIQNPQRHSIHFDGQSQTPIQADEQKTTSRQTKRGAERRSRGQIHGSHQSL
jgi:hypothetical protein